MKKNTHPGKGKVIELTRHTVEANGLTYIEAIREARRLAERDTIGTNGEADHQYDVAPSRRRKNPVED